MLIQHNKFMRPSPNVKTVLYVYIYVTGKTLICINLSVHNRKSKTVQQPKQIFLRVYLNLFQSGSFNQLF